MLVLAFGKHLDGSTGGWSNRGCLQKAMKSKCLRFNERTEILNSNFQELPET